MVEQEAGAVRNATLASIEQLRTDSKAMHADVKVGLVTVERTDKNTESLITRAQVIQKRLESKFVTRSPNIFHLWYLR